MTWKLHASYPEPAELLDKSPSPTKSGFMKWAEQQCSFHREKSPVSFVSASLGWGVAAQGSLCPLPQGDPKVEGNPHCCQQPWHSRQPQPGKERPSGSGILTASGKARHRQGLGSVFCHSLRASCVLEPFIHQHLVLTDFSFPLLF